MNITVVDTKLAVKVEFDGTAEEFSQAWDLVITDLERKREQAVRFRQRHAPWGRFQAWRQIWKSKRRARKL